MKFDNRIARMRGMEIPLIPAPMVWIACSQLASAVSNAGGGGTIKTSSGKLEVIREESRRRLTLANRPFGANFTRAFVKDSGIEPVVRILAGFRREFFATLHGFAACCAREP